MSGKNTPCIPADSEGIARAAGILGEEGLVAIPTETVYGLAGRADSEKAVARIFAAKGRPAFNPLIVHVANLEQAGALTNLDANVADWHGMESTHSDLRTYVAGVWPGPVTLVVPLRAGAPLARAVTAGLDTVALRMPAHPVARALIERTGPLAAPSANRSGFVSPTTAGHVLATLDGRIDLVLDAGPTQSGVESTILKLREDGRWRQLRAGPLDTSLYHESHFPHDDNQPDQMIEAPGQLASHYSPGKPVRLNAREARTDEFFIGFGTVEGDISLSNMGDLEEAAARLYACLHEGAAASQPRIAVAAVPERGIGLAINDRLRRAAA